jgi:redox-sensitive bicupin YhaK (pirin superfamily)
LPLVTSYGNKKSTAPIKIHADINMYATYLTRNKTIKFETNKKRQTYLVLIEGKATINKIKLVPRDAIEIREEDVIIQTSNFAHIIVLEMALKY